MRLRCGQELAAVDHIGGGPVADQLAQNQVGQTRHRQAYGHLVEADQLFTFGGKAEITGHRQHVAASDGMAGYGTGGTVTGVGQMLKLARPDIQIVITEPENASLLNGSEWAPHKIQGWTPDFIPDVLDFTHTAYRKRIKQVCFSTF